MIGLLISFAVLLTLIAFALVALDAGMRAGDRCGDVSVSAMLGFISQADGCLPVVVATVRNPGTTPVLVGLSARRRRVPAWLDTGMRVRAPRRTTGRRLRADRQQVVGIAGTRSTGHWTVPLPPRTRRCRLTAVIGQEKGRLRVLTLPVSSDPPGSSVAGSHPLPEWGR